MALWEEKLESSLLVAAQPQLAARLDVHGAVLEADDLHVRSALTVGCQARLTIRVGALARSRVAQPLCRP